jgi:hypothetical protein
MGFSVNCPLIPLWAQVNGMVRRFYPTARWGYKLRTEDWCHAINLPTFGSRSVAKFTQNQTS